MVSFAVKKFLVWYSPICLFFSFISLALGVNSTPRKQTIHLKNGQSTGIDTCPEDIQIPDTWKDAWCHQLSEKCKLKSQWHITSHQSEWLSSINQQTTSAGEDAVKRGTPVDCWWECRLVQPLWKAVWSCLKKWEVELPYDPVILLLGIYPKKPQNTTLKEYMHPYVHCCIIYNSQNLEAARVPTSRWVDNKAVVHPHNGTLPDIKKENSYLLPQHQWTGRVWS